MLVDAVFLLVVLAIGAIGALTNAVSLRFCMNRHAAHAGHEARTLERDRLARALHDELLQGTQGLVFSVGAAVSRLAMDDAIRLQVDGTLRQAERLLVDVRARAEALQLLPADETVLAESLAAIAATRVREDGHGSLPTEIEVLGRDRRCNAFSRDRICSLARQALLDADVRAGARAIEVQVIYADDALRIRIRHDGRGLAADAWARASPHVQRMDARAQELGAKLEVWSSRAAGTELELIVPAGRVYEAMAAPRRAFPQCGR
jgi:signal transduction histidine kinase